LVYFLVRGSNIHEIVIFDAISCILDASRSRWASDLVVGRLCIFLICAVLVKLTYLTH